jgi:exodeoxyribonuclease-3
MQKVRERNIGWRIDYFITSDKIKDHIREAGIFSEIMGSDHCPISLKIDF